MSGGYYPLYRPALDHPPVFSSLVGLAATISGATPIQLNLEGPANIVEVREAPLGRVRLLSVLLFSAAFWVLWKWLRLITGFTAALIAMLIYSLVESIAIHQRLLVPDNLCTPLLLLAFYVAELWRRNCLSPGRAAAVIIPALGLAIASKLVALAAVPALFCLVSVMPQPRGYRKLCLWALAGAGVGLAITLLDAARLDWQMFVAAMKSQSSRFIDFTGLLDLIRHQPLLSVETFSPWLLSGWLLAFAQAGKSRLPASKAFFAIMIGFAFGYVFFAPIDCIGWYLAPFYPFLAAAWGISIREAHRNPQSLSAKVTYLLLLSVSLTPVALFLPEYRPASRYLYAALAALWLIPWSTSVVANHQRKMRFAMIIVLAVGLLGEILSLVATVNI